MSRFGARALAVLGLLGMLGAFNACIKKRPPAEPAPVGPAPTTVSAPAETPTGKYGQVAGSSLLSDGIKSFALQGKTERATMSFVPVEGQPFTEALRAEVTQKSGNNWDVQVQTRVAQAVAVGDVILATFYAKTEATRQESGEGQTELVMELARPPWAKSVSYPVHFGRDWTKIYVRYKAERSYAPGEAQLIFRLGYEPETIQIGGVTVENFGKQLVLADLPTTKITYPGMEPDAPWRQAAAARIEQLRKQELSISVQDKNGKPVAGADVVVHQTKQAFGFGSAVVAQTLNGPGNERYKELTAELFNTAVFENNLKWQPLAGDWGGGWTVDAASKGVDWLHQHDIQVRGHVLVWPSWRNLPRAVKALEKEPSKLRAAVNAHVTELATAMRGKLVHWDVMNEPFDNHDLMDLFGDDVMVEWFKGARAADPDVKLFINDYAILSGGPGDTPHRDHYEKTIKFLIDKGAPLDGIGMQGHFGAALTGPEDLLKLLDRYAKLGKQIWITEYDLDIDDEALAGQFTRDFYTTLFSHPAVGGILMWGFWDGAHWHRNAPLYRKDWSLKPAGEAYRELVLKAWRTNEQAKTDASGAYKTRAFLGKYAISASSGGKTRSVEVELRPGSAPVVLKLD
ncbi:MAG: endo-1,4-beta-xylanase [Myxococcales bacterium]